jgi:acyl-CoA synthetase (AMP-forming)/AMP-acid ligase II
VNDDHSQPIDSCDDNDSGLDRTGCSHDHDHDHAHSCDSATGAVNASACGDNVAARLTRWAKRLPGAIAIAEPSGPVQPDSLRSYDLTTYKELDDQSDRIALGLGRWGVRPGMRIVMLVPFGAMFIRLTFSLLKAGVVVVLIDPGMGRKHLVDCLSQSEPDGFIGIPKAQAIRALLRKRFPNARWNVTVGRRWFWGGKTLKMIESYGDLAKYEAAQLPKVSLSDDAAIIFTTGSTGPPKGVAYTQGTFNAQVDMIRQRYDIKPGTRDLACFPLFGLYDNVMGATTIIPDMDPTRPADVNPQRLFEAVNQWDIDQAFGSPALWHRVVTWCETTGNRFPTLRRVLSAGAPVPAQTLQRLRRCVHPEADISTPYGATEALPLASIESRQVITETGPASAKGRGVCVGTRFDGIRWRVIQIDDGPIASI